MKRFDCGRYGAAVRAALAVVAVLAITAAEASILGSVRGLIHDPQHRPVTGAAVRLRAVSSEFSSTATSDAEGSFVFRDIPIGEYTVSVEAAGFQPQEKKIAMSSGREVRLHFPLQLGKVAETVEVTDQPMTVNPASSSSASLISRADIAQTPGADQANSLAMITSNVPGAYVVHDQLHIRGGHQVSWLLDGVPVPNTNIASNVGPQFDPKDIDYLEVQRGGYNAEYGDRAYGVFNVVTRSGFERNRQGELVASYGSFNNTDNQISFGDHSERLAYFGSFSGYRTDLGLETPVTKIEHDQAAGLGAFGSMIFNRGVNDQLRLVASLRGDHYQAPVDRSNPESGLNRDTEDERDTFANFSWIHTAGAGFSTTVSPFFHFNRAHYRGRFAGAPDDAGSGDIRVPEDDRGSTYFGGTAATNFTGKRHNAHVGVQAFGQRDNQLFGVTNGDGTVQVAPQRERAWGSVTAVYVEDQFRPTEWLTINGGVRLTHFQGPAVNSAVAQPGQGKVVDNAADPRIGAAVQIPRLHWVARAFWGRYYQSPPLLTVSGPLLQEVENNNAGFLPLHGERDEQREFGIAIPWRGWTLDVSDFRTGARNFFDHDALGNSNIFFPLTIARARIRGTEASLSAPKLFGRAQFHAVYSHQFAEGFGGVTGGLTDFSPPEDRFALDHDQRDTLGLGVEGELPGRVAASFNVNYGSGFLNGDGPGHLPSHTTYDLSLARSFGENWAVRLTGLNLGNHHYLLDNSNTFGGTHFANPREISVQVKYRFRY